MTQGKCEHCDVVWMLKKDVREGQAHCPTCGRLLRETHWREDKLKAGLKSGKVKRAGGRKDKAKAKAKGKTKGGKA